MATVGASHKEVQYITVLFLHEFKTSKRICTGQGLCLRITYASNQAQATHRGPQDMAGQGLVGPALPSGPSRLSGQELLAPPSLHVHFGHPSLPWVQGTHRVLVLQVCPSLLWFLATQ